MSRPPHGCTLAQMPRFMLEHRHEARECGIVFASFNAFDSPLRHGVVSGSCDFGTHRIWWDVQARNEAEALSWLPHYVAARTRATRMRDLQIP
jgi:hypothetical protein